MAVFRIVEGKARPGSVEEVANLLVRQAQDVVGPAEGLLFVQSLRSGDHVMAVSSWRTTAEMEGYLGLDSTQDFYRKLPELLMGMPSVRTYEVIEPDTGGAGWGRS